MEESMKYKRILVATDLMEGAEVILKKASELAKQMKADLHILHVVEPLPGYGYAFIGSAEIEVELVKEAKSQLNKLAKKYEVDTKHRHVEIGPTKVEITRIAEDFDADLIIVGSHGHSGFGALLGSTANAVVHNAKCDVLTVRLKEE